jgi:hypothetical protein
MSMRLKLNCWLAAVNCLGFARVLFNEDGRCFREEEIYMREQIVVPFFVMATIGWLAWVIFSSIRRYLLAKEMDLKRATRPLIVMRILSAVYVVLCAAWALHSFWRPVSMELMSGWNAFRGGAVGFGAAIALLAIANGAWYLLYDGRRSDTGIPST